MTSCWWYHSALTTNGCFILEALRFALLIESETSGPRINWPWWSVPERKRWDIIYVYSCRANAISLKIFFFYRPQKKLREGKVFTGVSLFTGRRGSVTTPWGRWVPTPLDTWDTTAYSQQASYWNAFLFYSETTNTLNCVYTGAQSSSWSRKGMVKPTHYRYSLLQGHAYPIQGVAKFHVAEFFTLKMDILFYFEAFAFYFCQN